MSRSRLLLPVALVLLTAVPAAAQDIPPADAAVRNYVDVIEGRRQYAQLTARERIDVDEVARLVYEKKLVIDLRTSEERCRASEAAQASGAPSDLARRIIDMKCREAF